MPLQKIGAIERLGHHVDTSSNSGSSCRRGCRTLGSRARCGSSAGRAAKNAASRPRLAPCSRPPQRQRQRAVLACSQRPAWMRERDLIFPLSCRSRDIGRRASAGIPRSRRRPRLSGLCLLRRRHSPNHIHCIALLRRRRRLRILGRGRGRGRLGKTFLGHRCLGARRPLRF
jgi:hypothetical protein